MPGGALFVVNRGYGAGMEFSHAGDPRYVTVETRSTVDGVGIAEVRPARCPNGHDLAGRNCRTGWGTAPDGLPRRSWTCVACSETTWGV